MPSQRSWEERTRRATAPSAGAADDDPLADQRVAADELPLVRVQRAGLGEDRVRDRDLADVVQLGGVAHALGLVSVRPRRRAVASASSATPSRWVTSSGSRSVSARSSTSLDWRVADVRPAFFCAYMRWSAMRSASVGVLRLARQHDRAVGAGDVEALAVLGQRRRGAAAMIGSRDLVAGSKSAQNSSPPMRNARPRPPR